MGIVSRLYNYVAGDTIVAAQNNANENAIVTSVNNVDTAQVVDAAITTAKIKDANVTAAKLADGAVTVDAIGTGSITAVKLASDSVTADKIVDGVITSAKITDGTLVNADINASAAIVDTKLATITTAGKVNTSALTGDYAASNSSITDSGGYYTGTDVETALQEIGAGSGSSSGVGYADFDYDATTAANCSVLIPANTATTGIIIDFSCEIHMTAGQGIVPLEVKIGSDAWLNLSPATADTNPKFRLYMQIGASGDVMVTVSKTAAFIAADGFDATEDIYFRFGNIWSHTSPGTLLASKFQILATTF